MKLSILLHYTTFLISLSFSEYAIAQSETVLNWQYIEVDDSKSRWGDHSDPKWLNYFGLEIGDVNNDKKLDLLSGRWLYIQPKSTMDDQWRKIDLGTNVDGILILNVDDDDKPDIIGQALPKVYWLEAKNDELTEWEPKVAFEIPKASHTNSQGFKSAQIIAGGKEEILIASNHSVYCISIPKKVKKDYWNVHLIAENTTDEGIGVGDLDNDGDLDIVTGRIPEGGDEPTEVVWFENDLSLDKSWRDRTVGKVNHAADRIEVGDLNGDNLLDIAVAEERWPGKEPDANIFWFAQKRDSIQSWERNHVVTQYSSNNLALADMDDDGDLDIVTSEHKGIHPELQLWSNDGEGQFKKQILDVDKESHLGTHVEDLDDDGDLDIVSIGWDNPQYVHVWRNDRINTNTIKWTNYSTRHGKIENHGLGNQQTSSLAVDVNKDGSADFFIAERTKAPSLTLHLFKENQWIRHIVEAGKLNIEAGAASADIDGDGDMDVVMGGSSGSNEVWWWENPYPRLNPEVSWVRRTIKNSGKNKHHDQLFGDFDGDDKLELIFWNQGDKSLILAEIPENPKQESEWPWKKIYTYGGDSEMEPIVGIGGYPNWSLVNEHEGLTKIDMDGDGIQDILGGGRWFKLSDGQFIENIIDASYAFSRCIAGQFIDGGRPEVIMSVGDGKGPMFMYQWIEWEGWQGSKKGTGTWKRIELIDELDNGHSLQALDFNGDGHLDFFSAEMRFGTGNPDSKARIFLGNGQGQFQPITIVEGFGIHEGQMADLDGDGDLDLLGKPYTWNAPLINVWLNEGLIQESSE